MCPKCIAKGLEEKADREQKGRKREDSNPEADWGLLLPSS